MAPETMDALDLLRPFSKADVFARPSSAIQAGAMRLEAGFYGSQGYRAAQAMEDSGYRIERVGEHAIVKWFGPFSRIYVSDPAHGTPFLSSSDMMVARLEPQNHLSNALTRDLPRLMVADGTILVSCSGTIGNVCFCTRDYNGHGVSQHAIRVDALDPEWRGVLYVFLLSEVGRFLITRNKSGSVIESIYAEDIERLPLPILPKRLRERINQDIGEASRLRVEANRLLMEAERRVQVDCGLPDITSVVASPPDGQAITFSASASESLFSTRTYFGDLRLDATAYHPSVHAIRRAIKAGPHGHLASLVSSILYIGKVYRNFVDDAEVGTPLLSGKDLVMLRPRTDKYMSRLDAKHIKRCQIEKGWVLVSRSGNVGRVAMCHRNWEGYVGSEHILRIIPDKGNGVDPYFLYAFLSSDWGAKQLDALIYGSVILTLSKEQIGSVAVPIPADKGVGIGGLVKDAYDHRADAMDLEHGALHLFMQAIDMGREATEREWGREY